jgi:Uma2 family endonuclease
MTVLIEGKRKRIPLPKLLTYEDYAKLTPPDSGNYELHNGKIIFMPTPIPKHQLISSELHILLGSYIKTHKLGKLIAAPMDTVFSPNDTLQPDLLFIAKDRLYIIGEKKIEGVPDFIVEIHSRGNTPKEMSYKKFVYETTGVKEYWVIYPEQKMIKQFENQDFEFVLRQEARGKDTLSSFAIEGFSFDISDIFE